MLLVLLVVIDFPILFALDYLGRLRLRKILYDMTVGRRHGKTIRQVKIVTRVNHRQGERLGAIDARHTVPSLNLPVTSHGLRNIRRDSLLDANLVFVSGGSRRCKVLDRLKYVICFCQLSVTHPYTCNYFYGAVSSTIVHKLLLCPVTAAILRLGHLIGGLALVLRAIANRFAVSKAPLMWVGSLGWPEQGAFLKRVRSHGISIVVLFVLDLLELVVELLFIELICHSIVFKRCLVCDDVLDRILLEAHILGVEDLILGVAHISGVLHRKEALLLQRSLLYRVDRLHGPVLMGDSLPIVPP